MLSLPAVELEEHSFVIPDERTTRDTKDILAPSCKTSSHQEERYPPCFDSLRDRLRVRREETINCAQVPHGVVPRCLRAQSRASSDSARNDWVVGPTYPMLHLYCRQYIGAGLLNPTRRPTQCVKLGGQVAGNRLRGQRARSLANESKKILIIFLSSSARGHIDRLGDKC